ncbi:hypothetical protein DAH66_12605 [Sphingomonas koreensis]|uniref:Uncharacterized protein n=1 Tax=Sphingomonas koreensis TaxID=93064 RepID=A0A430G2B0_9SPHN|nr:hypothetical protein DAH66_12605 [Sphingomonas koreensis]
MTRRAIILLALIAMLAGAIVFGLSQCQRAQTAKTTANVAKGQAGAAIESGSDAVDAIGNRAEQDAAADRLTRENEDAIRKAEGASAPVAAPVRDAGLDSLCRRAAYSRDPRCLQPPASR